MIDRSTTKRKESRPLGVVGIGTFFALGALISLTSAGSLLWPNSPLKIIWRINPPAQTEFAKLGKWAPLLLGVVGMACALSAIGLFRGKRWGHRLALAVFSVNLLGDLGNAIFREDKRALIGVPIVAVLMGYLLTSRVRQHFARSSLPSGNSKDSL